MKRKIFLLGFMGCGKSTIGEALSHRLKLKSVDLDEVIEIRERSSISELFSSVGEEAFRQMESEALQEILLIDSLIIALGGGTPCFNDNMKLIDTSGISFYIELSPEKLARRLYAEKDHRPLIKNEESPEDLVAFIRTKLEARATYYTRAHHTINGDASVDAIVSDIISRLDP